MQYWYHRAIIRLEFILSSRILIPAGSKVISCLLRKKYFMVKSTRKFAALFLSFALLFSLSNTALAAETHDHDCGAVACEDNTIGESVSPMSACQSHTWQYKTTCIGGTYVSATYCNSRWEDTKTCTNCGRTEHVKYSNISNDSHISVVYSASCNGTTQTLQNRCSRCKGSLPTTTKRCPGGPHSGVCRYLPL